MLNATHYINGAEFKQVSDIQVAGLCRLVQYKEPNRLSVASTNTDRISTPVVGSNRVAHPLSFTSLSQDLATRRHRDNGSIGASIKFSRRYGAAQAFIILIIIIPLGPASALAMWHTARSGGSIEIPPIGGLRSLGS